MLPEDVAKIDSFREVRRKQLCSNLCGNKTYKTSKSGLCSGCFNDQKGKHIPPFEEIKHKIEALGYVKAGNYFGISDNALRKWVKFYGEDPKVIKKKKKLYRCQECSSSISSGRYKWCVSCGKVKSKEIQWGKQDIPERVQK
jgi:hypothetical protein